MRKANPFYYLLFLCTVAIGISLYVNRALHKPTRQPTEIQLREPFLNMRGRGMSGEEILIDFHEKARTLLALLLPSQLNSDAEMEFWEAISEALDASIGQVFVLVETERAEGYVDIPVRLRLCSLSAGELLKNGIEAAPMIIIVSQDGIAQRWWIGNLSQKDRIDIQAALNLPVRESVEDTG